MSEMACVHHRMTFCCESYDRFLPIFRNETLQNNKQEGNYKNHCYFNNKLSGPIWKKLGDCCRMTCRLRWFGLINNVLIKVTLSRQRHCRSKGSKLKPDVRFQYVRANSMECYPRATYHIAGCCHLVNSLSRFTISMS